MPPTCAFCLRDLGGDVAPAASLAQEVELLILANNPWWRREEGLCADCATTFEEAAREVRSLFPSLARAAAPILPTPVRLGASDPYRGRGVTIAFLDSGFFAHPDLVEPRDRIVRYVDITRKGARRADLDRPDESSWHGMMTSVVACGNGRLSGGIYQGLASEANLVLVKVGTARRIKHDDIRRGLAWVVRNRKRYGIRIVNVSCGGDYEASYLKDGLSKMADRATAEGLLVCAAAGNLGHLPRHPVIPPASAPSVLTVGGLDDKNRPNASGWDIYHSSYGPTVDGLQKPEVIAPGIWVAAPILPGTPDRVPGRAALPVVDRPRRQPAADPPREPRDRPRPRRGAGSPAPAPAPAREREAARQQRDLRGLQARRRDELRRAHRGLARRAPPRGQPLRSLPARSS